MVTTMGVALAVISFVEVTLADSSPVRVYSTDVQAEGLVRAHLARVLLAHSRLGVLMVGDLPAHVLTAQVAPLHEAMMQGSWPNRDLLLVPLGNSIGLAAPSAQLGHHTPVAVHVTPHAAKPKHVWTFVGGAWNRLHSPMSEHLAYDFSADTIDGRPQPLSDYSGQLLLVVNTASACGYTPQFAGLESLWKEFQGRGLTVMGFPATNSARRTRAAMARSPPSARRTMGSVSP
jgi:hypothetical protein